MKILSNGQTVIFMKIFLQSFIVRFVLLQISCSHNFFVKEVLRAISCYLVKKDRPIFYGQQQDLFWKSIGIYPSEKRFTNSLSQILLTEWKIPIKIYHKNNWNIISIGRFVFYIWISKLIFFWDIKKIGFKSSENFWGITLKLSEVECSFFFWIVANDILFLKQEI